MDGEVQVTLRGYQSASEYEVDWESDGKLLRKEFEPQPKHSWSNTSWLDTFTLQPGDYLYVTWYQNDDDNRYILIQVPTGAEFEKFVEAASKAQQAKWRDDRWILEFGVSVWDINDEEYSGSPCGLAEAIEMFKHQSS